MNQTEFGEWVRIAHQTVVNLEAIPHRCAHPWTTEKLRRALRRKTSAGQRAKLRASEIVWPWSRDLEEDAN